MRRFFPSLILHLFLESVASPFTPAAGLNLSQGAAFVFKLESLLMAFRESGAVFECTSPFSVI
jgi:hypothetical protein